MFDKSTLENYIFRVVFDFFYNTVYTKQIFKVYFSVNLLIVLKIVSTEEQNVFKLYFICMKN